MMSTGIDDGTWVFGIGRPAASGLGPDWLAHGPAPSAGAAPPAAPSRGGPRRGGPRGAGRGDRRGGGDLDLAASGRSRRGAARRVLQPPQGVGRRRRRFVRGGRGARRERGDLPDALLYAV